MATKDSIDVKEQIRRLKVQLQSLQKEKNQLKIDIDMYETKYSSIIIGTNILRAMEEASLGEEKNGGGDDTMSVQSHNTTVDNQPFTQEFLEANMKLEINLLTNEMKANMMKLEKESIHWSELNHEADINKNAIELRRKQIPPSLLSATNVQEYELKKFVDKKNKRLG